MIRAARWCLVVVFLLSGGLTPERAAGISLTPAARKALKRRFGSRRRRPPRSRRPKAKRPARRGPATARQPRKKWGGIKAPRVKRQVWRRWGMRLGAYRRARTFKFKGLFRRLFTTRQATVGGAKAFARMPLDKASTDTLARILYILEREAPRDAKAFNGRLQKHRVAGAPVAAHVRTQAKFYHELYDVPCAGKPLKRVNRGWPPVYKCTGARVKPPTVEPQPFVRLTRAPMLAYVAGDADKPKAPPKRFGNDVFLSRVKAWSARDRLALPPGKDGKDGENLAVQPKKFCYRKQCYASYVEVAAAIYGRPGSGMYVEARPVFCAPRRLGSGWAKLEVKCSPNWLDTLGGWRPWDAEGKPAKAAKDGQIPPFACLGSPHVLAAHMILPPGGAAGRSGFHCRRRIFRVMVKQPEGSESDRLRNIVRMCAVMRQQVWGEKYRPPQYEPINVTMQKWCNGPRGPKDKRLCTPPDKVPYGAPGAPEMPFMLLSREELLYFYGHQELFCRADRPGLTHFLYNDEWAGSFTCGVARGVLEAGPFEEGVQVCAVVPFGGKERAAVTKRRRRGGIKLVRDPLKARLHCWKFNRPTCEALSLKQKPEDLYKSQVFDAYDAMKQFRRTRKGDVWRMYDLKEAEKLQDWADKIAFSDSGKDEGVFGVREFCRFVSYPAWPSARRPVEIQCGYSKASIAHWYELRRNETPEGCDTGVCTRGAFARGYYCGLFRSDDLFEGKKPVWICGLDTGQAGRKRLARSRALCVGGRKVRGFQSPKGDRASLQCYERRFLWGESEESERVARRFSWPEAVAHIAAGKPRLESWLWGWRQAEAWVRAGKVYDQAKGSNQEWHTRGDLNIKDVVISRRAFEKLARQDDKELVHWARKVGHTLGHLTSLRKLLMRSGLTAIAELRKLRILERPKLTYTTFGCRGLACMAAMAAPTGDRCNNRCPAFESVPGKGQKSAVPKETAQALNGLLDEVRKGGRPPDNLWYQEFRLAATDDDQLRVRPDQLATVARVNRLLNILRHAREILFREARTYANVVAKKARSRYGRGEGLLARPELLERARASGVARALKGNVFCVADRSGRYRSRLTPYVCASSPLLVAGAFDNIAARKQELAGKVAIQRSVASGKASMRGAAQRDKQRNDIRKKVAIDWCYGGLKGWRIYQPGRSAALSGFGLSSPFKLALPASIIDRRPPAKRRAPRPSSRRFVLRRPPRRRVAPKRPPRRRASRRFNVRLGRRKTAKRSGPRGAKPKLSAGAPKGLAGVFAGFVVPPTRSAVNWLKCTGFQYSDESWEHADPSKERAPKSAEKKEEQTKVAGMGKLSTGDPDADEEVEDFMKEAQGFFGDMIRMVAPRFADALDRVKDMAHASQAFIARWFAQLKPLVEKTWKPLSDKIAEARKKLQGAKEEVPKKYVAFRDAEVKEAGVSPKQKQKKAKAKQKVLAAREAWKQAKDRRDALQKALEKLLDKIPTKLRIEGSGAKLNAMLTDLNKDIVKRVSAVIKPNTRQLLNQVFRFVRNLIDPIAKGLISSLAAIPFAGPALVAVGSVAFSMALDALEDAAFEAIYGIVERILAGAVRPALTPVFNAVRAALLARAYAYCTSSSFRQACPPKGGLAFGALPPRDRWLKRALACGRRAPVLPRGIKGDAALARREMLERAARMRAKVGRYARNLANRYFARYGLTYRRWMAMVKGIRRNPAALARATAVTEDLHRRATELRLQRIQTR